MKLLFLLKKTSLSCFVILVMFLFFLSSCEYTFEQAVIDAREMEIVFYPYKNSKDTLIFKTQNKVQINWVSSWYLGFEEVSPEKVTYEGKIIFSRSPNTLGVLEFSLNPKNPHYRYFLRGKWHHKKLTLEGYESLFLLRKTRFVTW